MKKAIIIALAALFLMGNVFAVNPNLSIDYVRMLARYATVNSSDAAIFNPAGLPKIENGLHINLTNQFVYKTYAFKTDIFGHISNGDSTRFSFLFPSASIAFKLNNWAVFANFTVPDGGGALRYTINFPIPLMNTATDIIVDASSQWFDVTLGGSYAINKYIALSLGARLLLPSQTMELSFNPEIPLAGMTNPGETKISATGIAGQFGVNITPIEKLNIGLLYKSQAFWVNGDKNAKGNPSFYAPNTIQLGIGYDVIENLNVQFGYKINLEALTPDRENAEYENSMDFTLGAEYQINKLVKPSLGVGYQMSRGTKKTNSDMAGMINPDLDAFVIGAGVVVTPVKNLNITLGYMFPIFFKEKVDGNLPIGGVQLPGTELSKTVHVFGIGVSYKFF